MSFLNWLRTAKKCNGIHPLSHLPLSYTLNPFTDRHSHSKKEQTLVTLCLNLYGKTRSLNILSKEKNEQTYWNWHWANYKKIPAAKQPKKAKLSLVLVVHTFSTSFKTNIKSYKTLHFSYFFQKSNTTTVVPKNRLMEKWKRQKDQKEI